MQIRFKANSLYLCLDTEKCIGTLASDGRYDTTKTMNVFNTYLEVKTDKELKNFISKLINQYSDFILYDRYGKKCFIDIKGVKDSRNVVLWRWAGR